MTTSQHTDPIAPDDASAAPAGVHTGPTGPAGLDGPEGVEVEGTRVVRGDLVGEWWAVALRGVIAVVFGLVALVWPGPTVAALALLFGLYALADGLFAAGAAFRVGRLRRRRWALGLEGLAGIVAGLIAIFMPALVALTLVAFIGAWALFTGVMEIIAAVRLRREIENEWLLGLGGVLSVLFGLFAVASPGTSVLALVWVVGVYAIAFGITLLALGWRLRTLQSTDAPSLRAI